ncbi:MAG TPA: hydroxymethylpyrimidine/phosphomethylpyrimidine kinase, partial [Burkholderiales bacterium]
FKIGVLGSARHTEAVAAVLEQHPRIPVVLDPVLASGRGDVLADAEVLLAIRTRLLPRTTVATPNSVEARRLAQAGADADLAECARVLIESGCRYVLVTGTHEAGAEVVNRLFGGAGLVREDRWPRLAGDYHGSGCTLASAVAAYLAKGMDVPAAARAAQDYTWKSLQAGFAPGRGQQLPHRFFGAP